MTCDKLSNFVETMMIDEERIFTLTKYVTTRGTQSKIKSDHNPLFFSFNLSYEKQVKHSNRREVFDFNDKDAQEVFNIETASTTKFTEVFESDEPFEKQTQKFQRCLNQSAQKCFRKIRIRKVKKKVMLAVF